MDIYDDPEDRVPFTEALDTIKNLQAPNVELRGRLENKQQHEYIKTVSELQEIANNALYVTADWVLQVASMDTDDMRRRLIRNMDWHGHFAHSAVAA